MILYIVLLRIKFMLSSISQTIKEQPLSIYIHWPFCKAKCPYCDFNSHVTNHIDHEEWLASYIKEFNYFKDFYVNRTIKSIYFGGGTPSLMEPHTVAKLLEHLQSHAHFATDIEITLEANPTSIEYNKFKAFKAAGINRVSIGVQSFTPHNLKFLGREHSANEAREAIAIAQEIFPRYSFDLIYALPNQTLTEWELELKEALKLAKDHISLYQLTIEKGTKFFTQHKKGEFIMPDEELSNEFYFLTEAILKEHNFEAYEISNYASGNNISQHNMCYWQYNDYLGIGPGAHSRLRTDFLEHHALYMIYNPQNWLDSIKINGHAIQKKNKLTKEDVITEMTLMGLRIKNGISHTQSHEKLGQKIQEFFDLELIENFIKQDLLVIDIEKFYLTASGLRVADYIIKKLIASQKHYL